MRREVPEIRAPGPDAKEVCGFSDAGVVQSTEDKVGRVWSFIRVLKKRHGQEGMGMTPGVGLMAGRQRRRVGTTQRGTRLAPPLTPPQGPFGLRGCSWLWSWWAVGPLAGGGGRG